MNDNQIKDKGGRREQVDRRTPSPVAHVSEKRKGKDRRCGSDRRDSPDPIIRITGDERRKAFWDIDIF